MVYAISDGWAVKIGKTGRDIDRRLRELQNGNPRPLRFIAAIDFDVPDDSAEKRIHAYLENFRLSGEWFLLSAPMVLEIVCAMAGVAVTRIALEQGVEVDVAERLGTAQCLALMDGGLEDWLKTDGAMNARRGLEYWRGEVSKYAQ